jgi:uncharacterized OB-fold protein
MGRPFPHPDDLTRPFWDAANEHRLVAQRCGACGEYQHPPRKTCGSCGSAEVAFVQLSGRGVVYTHTTVHDTRVQGLKPYQPFSIAAVQLDESPSLVMVTDLISSNLPLEIGDRVEVRFEELAPGRTVPQFRKATPP